MKLSARGSIKYDRRSLRLSYGKSSGGNKTIMFFLYDMLLSKMKWQIGDKVFPTLDAGSIVLSRAYYGIKEKCYTISRYSSGNSGRVTITLSKEALTELKKYVIPCSIDRLTVESERSIGFSLPRKDGE